MIIYLFLEIVNREVCLVSARQAFICGKGVLECLLGGKLWAQ